LGLLTPQHLLILLLASSHVDLHIPAFIVLVILLELQAFSLLAIIVSGEVEVGVVQLT
jgi:hypothetical protein